MQQHLFQVWVTESPTPVTVYASNSDNAESAFSRWVTANRPGWEGRLIKTGSVSRERLFEDPALVHACDLADAAGLTSAILGYDDPSRSWIAFAPDAPFGGLLAQPHERVHAFEVRVEKDGAEVPEVLVFALDITHAVHLYLEWLAASGKPNNLPYRIDSLSKWKLKGPRGMLREAMEQGKVGIAAWSPDAWWDIYPPDHDLVTR